MVTGPGSALEKSLKEYGDIIKGIPEKTSGGGIIGSGNNAVAIDAKNITNYSASDKRVLMSADPFNTSNP